MEYLFSLLFIRLRAVVFKHIRHLVGAIGCSAVAFYPEVVETVGGSRRKQLVRYPVPQVFAGEHHAEEVGRIEVACHMGFVVSVGLDGVVGDDA